MVASIIEIIERVNVISFSDEPVILFGHFYSLIWESFPIQK